MRAILDFDPDRIELVRNADWLAAMDMADVLRLTGRTTVARIMERDDFSQRFADGVADRAVGAALPAAPGHRLGRGPRRRRARRHRPALQQPDGPPAPVGQAGQDPQVVITTPLLEGLDGVKKMSKSLGNYVGISRAAGRAVRQAHEHPGRR